MGYKLLRDTYKIEHIVQVCDKKEYGGRVICIGDTFVHDLIVITMEGTVVVRSAVDDEVEFQRYIQEFDADPEKLKRIVQTQDAFDADKNKTVYIFDFHTCKIRTEVCQEYGYPNTTNMGELLYDNTSFKTYKDALNFALQFTEFSKHYYKDVSITLHEAFSPIRRYIRLILQHHVDWVYVRTVLRFKSLNER